MAAHRLASRHVERIWGRRDLSGAFAPPDGAEPIGEIWFEGAADAELLVKYLFTSERLSIQVHPDDDAAGARGHRRGKDEAWYVLSAEPGAVIGLGLTREVSRDALRAAALDGSIEQLLDWRPVRAGETFYSPAGTIHAIGGGLSLVEIQQNLDLTYRLYDYGRPRELHLDEAIAVAEPAPWTQPFAPVREGPRTILAAGRAFVLERWSFAGDAAAVLPRDSVLIPLAARGRIDGGEASEGSVWAAEGPVRFEGGGDLLAAYPRGEPSNDVLELRP
ncbi:MAG: class I mannose-6-phosphate isomerase [Sphingomonadaceae bacterium]|nr:class I mannose-6-phosphate isomerase [Sphingomonadaceae bacterium]